MKVLSLNPGSSSLKFALHDIEDPWHDRCVVRGQLERLGTAQAVLTVEGETHSEKEVGMVRLSQAVKHAVETCANHAKIDAIGCRVVHGGPRFSGAAIIDAAALAEIRALSPLAPLHNARDVETIEGAQRAVPGAPVVAVFDTAFHSTLPPVAFNYALPKDLVKEHELRRYGFHGISYRFVTDLIAIKLGASPSRLIACHLGNGASICAVRNGKSIDTSMGMTPLEGLVMGTRSGDVDPGLILYLERERHIHMRDLDQLLNSQSGLAGLSGIGGDVRELEAASDHGNGDAELALELFAYRVAKYIGAYAVALEGLDVLVFCGGIGEHSPAMRTRICRRLGFLGIRLSVANDSPEFSEGIAQIDDAGPVSIWVARTDEERQIARETIEPLR